MKNKVIAFITSQTTHTSKERRKNTFKTQQNKHSHSRCKCVCKTRSKTTTKNRQPELHQLTTKQTKEKNIIQQKRKTLKKGKKQQRLSKLCFNQQTKLVNKVKTFLVVAIGKNAAFYLQQQRTLILYLCVFFS